MFLMLTRPWNEQGRPLHTLKDHAHWVTTLTLNTDFVLRTGPFDHLGKKTTSDSEGTQRCIYCHYIVRA